MSLSMSMSHEPWGGATKAGSWCDRPEMALHPIRPRAAPMPNLDGVNGNLQPLPCRTQRLHIDLDISLFILQDSSTITTSV